MYANRASLSDSERGMRRVRSDGGIDEPRSPSGARDCIVMSVDRQGARRTGKANAGREGL